jgi:uncharacterized flavoprotein (TIGR03862 family)
MPMETAKKKTVVIIGGGSAALMLASKLDESLFEISIYDKNHAPGRKFLVAGDGGFNLTHSEDPSHFIERYTPPAFFKECFSFFNNHDLRTFLQTIGIETYVGSSKRVFPVKGIKPIDVLNAFLEHLKKKNVSIFNKYEWKGWTDKNELIFQDASEQKKEFLLNPDITVFALGGASWKVTGSDGGWAGAFEKKGIRLVPFQASNCAYEIKWSPEFIKLSGGKSLKNIVLRCDDKEKNGELVITEFGLEGGAIYALSPQIRKQLETKGKAKIFLDLKPHLSLTQIKDKFQARGNRSVKKLLNDRLSFGDEHIELLKFSLSKEEFTDPEVLAEKIKNLPLIITSAAPLDEAISTVGGVVLREVDENFQLLKVPQQYCIGEMLNWDAPTGGYLLQGCFSMAAYLAKTFNENHLR